MTTREQIERLARDAFVKVFEALSEPDVFSRPIERNLLDAVVSHAVGAIRRLVKQDGLLEKDAFKKVAESVSEQARDMAIQSIALRKLPNTRLSLPLGMDIPEEERQAFESENKALLDLIHSLHSQLEEERKRREEAERRAEEAERQAQYAAPTSLDVVTPLFHLGMSRQNLKPNVKRGRRELRTYLSIRQPGSRAEVQLTLFGNVSEEQLRQIDKDVQNTLSPYGLKLVYLVMRECHHNGLRPWFRLDTNRCLDAMGYKRRKDEFHYSLNRNHFLRELRSMAENVMLNVEKRSPKGAHFDAAVVFYGPLVKITGKVEEWDNIPRGMPKEMGEKVAEDAMILVEPAVYRYVTEGWYTWIPERFLTIDPQEHGHAILLVAYCENQWKIGWNEHHGVIRQPLRQMLTGSGLIYEYQKIKRSDHQANFLKRARGELDWMADEGYIKSYSYEESRANPLDDKVTIVIPDDHGLKREEAEGKRLLPERQGLEADEELTPKRIREIREKFGLTQQQFAEELGVSRPTIAGAESGKRPVSKKLRGLISEFLYQKRA